MSYTSLGENFNTRCEIVRKTSFTRRLNVELLSKSVEIELYCNEHTFNIYILCI